VRQPELTSLLGLRDVEGDRLILSRVEMANGRHGYMLRAGAGKVFLTPGDLARLLAVIRFELVSANRWRILLQAVALAVFCGLVWLLASSGVAPLFAYPWSN
jgi:hypothetical protein